MKKILYALVILAIVVVIIIVVAFQLTSGVTETADKFFSAIGENDIATAYNDYLAEDFRAATSLAQLQDFLEQSALSNYQSASWSSRSISGDQGELEGSITTTDGGTVPITVSLVKEAGEWKILSIHKPSAGLISDEQGAPIPADDQLVELADAAILQLAAAINAGDFSEFHANVSTLWQAQITQQGLLDAFQSFVEQDIDLTAVRGLTPVFSQPPGLNADGVLQLDGYYPTQPAMTHFRFKYIYEHPAWKLFGVNVRLE